jgi:hypothetical protein
VNPDYDIICRDHAVGPLLAARRLQQRGYGVLLVPGASCPRLPSPFFLPLAAGTPRRLLAETGLAVPVDPPPAPLFCWLSEDGAVADWPATAAARRQWLGDNFVAGGEGWLDELLELYRIIDAAMAAGVQLPPVNLRHYGAVFRLLVRHEGLRNSRRFDAAQWMEERHLPVSLRRFLTALIPVTSLFRFADLPLLALAWGVGTLVADDAIPVSAVELGMQLRNELLAGGAEVADEPLPLVFDGKWCIGVGRDNRVRVRGRYLIVDGDHESLCDDIPPSLLRADVRRMLQVEHPGWRLLKEPAAVAGLPAVVDGRMGIETEVPMLSLPAAAPCTGTAAVMYLYAPAGWMRFSWQEEGRQTDAVATSAGANTGVTRNGIAPSRAWGCRPVAPAVMGGAFLPVARGYRRLFFAGWDNLPGFGLGGLVHAAEQVAGLIAAADGRT